MKNLRILFFFGAILVLSSCRKDKEDFLFDPADFTFSGDSSTFALPMAITPNGNNINDLYRLYIFGPTFPNDEATEFRIEIKRDNEKLYSTEDPFFTWNGTSSSGKSITGIVDVYITLGINGKSPKNYSTHLHIIRDNCVPQALSTYLFGDMIDARYGAIYETQETFCQ